MGSDQSKEKGKKVKSSGLPNSSRGGDTHVGVGEDVVTRAPKLAVKHIVGYWYNPEEPETFRYPKVEEGNADNSVLLGALSLLEKAIRNPSLVTAGGDEITKDSDMGHYEGFSECRICGYADNGCAEFQWKGWVWPEGLTHYLEAHKINLDTHPDADVQQWAGEVIAIAKDISFHKPVGFWFVAEEGNYSQTHPKPMQGDHETQDHTGLVKILWRLQLWIEKNAKQGSAINVIYHRGSTHCRLCGLQANGSKEYHWKGFRWPEGFAHYLLEHHLDVTQYGEPTQQWVKEVQKAAVYLPDPKGHPPKATTTSSASGETISDKVVIGYWKSDAENCPYPLPVAGDAVTTTATNETLAKSLVVLEKWIEEQSSSNPSSQVVQCVQYRGHSPCRLCDNTMIGSKEYTWKGFCWPEGTLHYIQEHCLNIDRNGDDLKEWATAVLLAAAHE